jgi:Host cell surface-exposed lipoprotein
MKKSTRITMAGVGGVTALFIGIGVANAGSGHVAATPKPSVSHSATASPSNPVKQVTPSPPSSPSPTMAQYQARAAAQGYLALNTGFSRQGLINQLTSNYGGQFSVADATWGVDHSGADWDAQAVLAAKGYLNLGTGFSRDGLIQQLTAPIADAFTYDQAVYAANQVGLTG